jgi:hypothetical protein
VAIATAGEFIDDSAEGSTKITMPFFIQAGFSIKITNLNNG